ncbi:MAG: hypothetical protein IKP06_00620 [Elusimicrobiaceae bacterium]|nr:hypothetical protein [Elusimicrobiaceae bacterium]
MKKFLIIYAVLSILCVLPVAAQTSGKRLYYPSAATEKAAPVISSEKEFLAAAKDGQREAILKLKESAWLLATDKFGNNCFHLAKDAPTLQALAAAVRRLSPEQSFSIISRLRNQRNNMGETPLMAHINYGKADTFRLLYEGSELAGAIREAKSVSTGGALLEVAEIKEGVVLSLAKDNSGRTVAQAAQANYNRPGMSRVVEFFRQEAPYLFEAI